MCHSVPFLALIAFNNVNYLFILYIIIYIIIYYIYNINNINLTRRINFCPININLILIFLDEQKEMIRTRERTIQQRVKKFFWFYNLKYPCYAACGLRILQFKGSVTFVIVKVLMLC